MYPELRFPGFSLSLQYVYTSMYVHTLGGTLYFQLLGAMDVTVLCTQSLFDTELPSLQYYSFVVSAHSAL